MAPPRDGRRTGETGGGDFSPPNAKIGGSKEPRPRRMGARWGVVGLKKRVPPLEFPSSSSAETPMSCEKRRERTVNGSGSTSSRATYPQFPFPSAAAADGEEGEPVLRIGEPVPAGKFRRQNDQPKVQIFGGGLPPKFCPFGYWPSRPIGELADGRGVMASDLQSATDRSDRLRLRIRGHPRTRGDVPRRLGRSNARRNALPPSGARSWAVGEGGSIIGLNGR